MHAVGIDIGGTKIAGALVDPEGNIFRELKVPSPARDADAMVDTVVGLINELADGHEVIGAGVAAAGFIDANQSTILYAPNLAWRNEPFKARLEERLDIRVIIENDANAAGWAEYRYGAGRGSKDMVMLTLGTGVGGAIVADSRLLRGGFGIGAELGHIKLVPGGKLCGCGQLGCLEQYGSGTALLNSAKELAASGDAAGQPLRDLQAAKGELTGAELYQLILAGDPGVLGLLDKLGRHVGTAIGSLVAVLDPQVVVIGGGVSAAGDLLLNPIREAYLEALPARGFRPELEVKAAEFLNDAGVIGVADLARITLSH